MRVLLVSWEYPPHVVTGVSTHVRGLARALAASGHDVVVFTPSIPDAPNVSDDHGVQVRRAAIDLPWIDDADLVASTASANHHLAALVGDLDDRLDGWRPDVVHGHDWTTGWAAHTIARVTRSPLVMTMHGTEHSRHSGHVPPGEPSNVHAVENWLAWAADLVVCNSQFMLTDVLDAFEIDPARVRLIPSGIDADSWAAPPDTTRQPLVMAWGRVLYEKGFQVIAQAMARLRGQVPELSAVIAGRGPYLAELQSQIDVEGVHDLVQLAGFVPDAELRSTLHRAGCVVIPSLYEPFGVVALEALAAGAPVIAADTGGLHEILADTGAALLFEPGNDAQLADAIARVLTDPSLAASLTTRARDLVHDTYSWAAVAARTVQTYRQVISDR